ncbi:MAG: Mu-like prophage major head subunit gpT family protein, partial [Myxococcota bacterium]
MSNQELLEATNDRFRVEFNDGLDTPDEELALLAKRESESNMEVNEDKFTLYLVEYNPKLDEFDGEVNYDAARLHAVSAVGKEYARGYSTPITELKNPVKREAHAAAIRKMGGAAAKTKLERAWMMLFEGDSSKYGLCYDGQPFMDADHPGADAFGGELDQVNLFEGLPLTAENLLMVLAIMTNYHNTVGQPFGNDWVGGQNEPTFRLWHGAALEKTVSELKMEDPAKQNTLAGTFTPR